MTPDLAEGERQSSISATQPKAAAPVSSNWRGRQDLPGRTLFTPTLVIRTPEGIEFALPLGGPFSRMLALAVDLAVIATLAAGVQKVLAAFVVFGQDFTRATQIVLFFAIYLAYSALAEWLWRGQTIGKKLLGLRVVDARGLRLEPAQVVVRNLMRFIDALPALYLAGGAACVFSRHRQRLGDLAAGTVVVCTPKHARPDLGQLIKNLSGTNLSRTNLSRTGTPAAERMGDSDLIAGRSGSVPRLRGKYNSLAEHRHLAARLRQKVSPEVARVAVESLLRRDEIEPSARLAVFAELAHHLRTLVPYPAETVELLADEQYVRDVVELLYRAP